MRLVSPFGEANADFICAILSMEIMLPDYFGGLTISCFTERILSHPSIRDGAQMRTYAQPCAVRRHGREGAIG